MAHTLGISGTPLRNGNTDKLVKAVMGQFPGTGKFIALRNRELNYCRGCDRCQKTKRCVIKDGMQTLEKELLKADVIVLGTPAYFNNVSAHMKNFMDRTNCLYQTRALSGKKMVAVAIGEANRDSIQKALDALGAFSRIHSLHLLGEIGVLRKGHQDLLEDGLVLERIKAVCKPKPVKTRVPNPIPFIRDLDRLK